MRQKVIIPTKTKFNTTFQRSQLETFLKQLGLRWNDSNEAVINNRKIGFIKGCIREDLGISDSIGLKVRWYDTGNAFSTAVDSYGNNVIQIHLGRKNEIFQVGFNKRSCEFLGLYYNKQLVDYNLLKNLL